jgi:ribonuclease R
MALHLSERERKATDAERELVEWKKVRFMASRIGEVYSGYVTGVQSFGLFVELQEVYVQGLVHVSSMGDDYYGFDEKAHRLLGENTGKSYRLGDVVKVRVVRVDQERRQVDLGLEDVIARVRDRGTARPPKPRSEKGASARPRGRAAAGSGGSRKAPKPRNPAPPRNRRKRR